MIGRMRWLVVCAVMLAGCQPSAETPPRADAESGTPAQTPANAPNGGSMAIEIPQSLVPFVDQARSELARRSEVAPEAIDVLAAEYVTWPNGALGCPEPDMMYTQALVPGYRIVLAVDGQRHHYHGARDKPPSHCPAARVSPPVKGGGLD